jgi:M6 family metalloprotease-like protein
VSIARWLLVAAVLACGASAARVDAPAADGASSRCRPAPTVPAVTEGASLSGTVVPSVGTVRALLLLVHASGIPPDESTAGPDELFDAAGAWFHIVSYGRLDFRAETLPRWLPLPATASTYLANPARYLRDAVAAADPFVDFARFDVVYLAPAARTSETATSAILNSFGVRADGRDIGFWVPWEGGFAASGSAPPATLVHETGHLLGLPDLYVVGVPSSFHRWDVMAGARWPSELLAWHRWKLGWLDSSQVVCVVGKQRQVATLSPVERPGGVKALFVKRGNRVLAVEVRARIGYDGTACETGVLVYEVDQTPFRRSPVRIHAAQSDRLPPGRDCAGTWNAPFELARGERRSLRLTGFRLDLLGRRADGSYRVRVVTS